MTRVASATISDAKHLPPAPESMCLLCGAEGGLRTLATHMDAGETYTLYECASCSGQFWDPLRNPGAEWYEHDERYADRNQDPITKPNEKHIGVMGYLRERKGRVLDVGCGVGNFLSLAQAKGWECWGIDFDRDAIAAAQATFQLTNLSVASLNEFAETYTGPKFDLITFFDVFEHIDNHREFLALAKSLLADDGSIALSVPYRDGWRWLMEHDLPPRHLTRWNEVSLRTILAKAGFRVVFIGRLPVSVRFLIMKLRFKYGAWASFNMVSRVGTQSTSPMSASKPAAGHSPKKSFRVRAVHGLAKTKDAVLFGIPAVVLWLALLPSRKRYTDIFLVAQVATKD